MIRDILIIYKRYKRKRRIIKYIESKLPLFHPETGVSLNWKVDIRREIIGYDKKTGEEILSNNIFPKIFISQQPALSGIIDSNVYGFNWDKKRLYQVKGVQWG